MAKRKIAILGGGVAGLTAALRLTEDPARRDALEVTVYSLGHRLGGKCASGRDASDPPAARIYEHGLHIFAGFYHNAFRVLKGCYDELGGKGGVVAADVYGAFRPKNDIVLIEHVDGRQIPWPITFLDVPGKPGEGDAVPSIPELLRAVVEAILNHFLRGEGAPPDLHARAPLSTVDRLGDDLKKVVLDAVDDLDSRLVDVYVNRDAGMKATPGYDPDALTALHHAVVVAHANAKDDGRVPNARLGYVISLLDEFEKNLGRIDTRSWAGDWLRRLTRGLNLAQAVLRGSLAGDVATKGFDHLDALELKDWLMAHGAWRETVDWGPVSAGYDYTFAYAHGDPSKPSLGAGTALRAFLRLIFAYKGALFWEMRGAMGEVVILPMYLTALARGVRFEFFRLATDVGLSPDGDAVETVELATQAETTGAPYEPLKTFGAIRYWPAEPDWSQLKNGAQMKAEGVDFESAWLQPKTMATRTLRRGADFDDVVLAIPTAELVNITPKLSAARADWKAMVEGLATTRTLALQLWLREDLAALGWKWPDRVLTVTAQPFSSWSDMSFLIGPEGWSQQQRPGSIVYFCGQMQDPATPPSPGDPTVPKQIHDEVAMLAKKWLAEEAPLYMPKAAAPNGPFGLDPDALFAPHGANGAARFAWQYWRGNASPWERYVQAAPKTVNLRKRGDKSGFANLWLAGDWTLNGINAGCVEAAVMSGLECANAMLGDPSPIPGERDV
jgi:uncharacterized protein with NAD-binding domain and iron-sulfur cluster